MKNFSLSVLTALLVVLGLISTYAGSQGDYPAYSGNKRIAIIMLAWADRACPATRSEMASKIWNNSDSLRKYYLDMSRNVLDFVPSADADQNGVVPATTTAIYGPYELSLAAGFTQDVTYANAESFFVGDYHLYGSHAVARDLAATDGFDAANYDYIMYVTPKTTNTGSTGGYAGVNGNYSHMFVLRQNYINHELGHNLGLSHSNTTIDVDGYSSQDCVMANGANAHLDGVHTYNMGWYPDMNFGVKSYGQYKIENLAADTDNLKVARFDRELHGVTTDKSYYNLWVAYRVKGIGQDVGLDNNWNRKVNIHLCRASSKRPGDYPYYYYFNNNVSKLSVTGNYTDPDNVCKVRYLREDNSGNDSAIIQLIDPNGNQPPSIPANQAFALTVGTSQFTVNATDLEGDALTYTIVSGPGSGTLANKGNRFVFTVSSEGVYQFFLRVNDGQYDSFDQTVTLNVSTASTPTVSVVSIDPDASEEGPDSGTWIIGRTGDLSVPLTVNFSLSGTATASSDYTLNVSSPVTLPAGQSSATVTLTPVDDDAFFEGKETATLTVTPNAAYGIGEASDDIVIKDNDNTPPSVNAGADRAAVLMDVASWTPLEAFPALWLDAGDSATIGNAPSGVFQWRDKSGHQRHVSQSVYYWRPAFSSGTISFDGSNDYLWNSLPFMYNLGSIDVYMVMSSTSYTDRRFLSEGSSTNGSPLYCIAQTLNTSSSIMSSYIREDGGSLIAGHPSLSGSGALGGGVKLYQWRDTGSVLSGRVNGGVKTSSAYTRSSALTLDRFSVGSLLRSAPGNFARVGVNEIVITPNLPDAERQKLEGYLAHKWGLAASLEAAHPYKTATPGSSLATVLLHDASVADVDGDVINAIWSVVSKPEGSRVDFDDPELVNATVTMNKAGTYVLRLTATDGTETVHDEVTITVGEPNSLPTISVATDDAAATEAGADTGSWTITRTGATTNALAVSFSMSGTATSGADYTLDATSPVTIPGGQSSVTITLTPVDDSEHESLSETAVLTIIPNAAYAMSTSTGGTITIADNDNNAPVADAGPDQTVSLVTVTTPTEAVTSSFKISSGNDDVEQQAGGSMSFTSSDIEMVMDGSVQQQVGLRFTNLDIPQGATITNAYIQFTVDETGSDSTSLTITGHDVDNANTFTSAANDVSDRVQTSASVNWNPLAWNQVGAAGQDQQTPDISSVVQEIVSRVGWSSGNALVLKVTGTGRRTAESYNGSSASAPELVVTYETGGEGVPLATATLAGSASDADGDATTATWSVVSQPEGSNIGLDDPDLVNATATMNTVGTYVLRLTATDGIDTTYDEVTITVTAGGNPIADVQLPAGISLYGYTGESPVDATVAFQTLIDNSQLSLVRWVEPATGGIKELYYTTFPSAGWINEIGDLMLGQGYIVKTTVGCTLSINGNKSTASVSFDLPSGYSIIGFNKETPIDAQTAFQPLIDAGKLELVRWVDPSSGTIKELYYTTFPSAGWVNEIGDLTEGQGYIIKLNAAHSNFSLP